MFDEPVLNNDANIDTTIAKNGTTQAYLYILNAFFIILVFTDLTYLLQPRKYH